MNCAESNKKLMKLHRYATTLWIKAPNNIFRNIYYRFCTRYTTIIIQCTEKITNEYKINNTIPLYDFNLF